MSLNRIMIIGNVGKDPDVREFNNGRKVALAIATTEKGYTTRDGGQVPDRTDWHTVIAFGGLADIASRYLRKGDKVYIEGSVRYRQYDSKEGGRRWVTEIYADKLELLTGRRDLEQVGPRYDNDNESEFERALNR